MKQEENISFSELTTFKIGGKARYFFRVKNTEEAGEALRFARQKGLPFFVLGGGSNLLASDNGFSGVVIKNEILGVSFTDMGDFVEVTAGAGEPWDAFVGSVVARGLYGLENLSGIPGTVGAAPVQNIGAYGVEAKDTIVSVLALEGSTGYLRRFANAECWFAYRDSFFKTAEGKHFVITGAVFRLKKNGRLNIEYKDLKNYFAAASKTANNAPTLQSVRQAVLEIRSGKFPDLRTMGTAGSFFKNPIIPLPQFNELKKKFPGLPFFPVSNVNGQMSHVKVPLAWILDNICNLKGYHKENVGLFERQPIVVVNTGNATAESVEKLAREVATCVKEKTGIAIQWEVEKL